MEFNTAIRAIAALLFASAIAFGAAAQAVAAAPGVQVSNAWVRAPAPGQKTASAYVELVSDRNAALVAAGSPAAGSVELHSMTMDGGVMRMRALPRIELPEGKAVKLAPGGLHLMLLDLKRPLKAGETVRLHLSVQETGPAAGMSLTTLELDAEVRPAAGVAHRH